MLLECERISKRFGGVHAVAEVDLSVRPGQVFGLIGPNGAGKTTLFDVVSGLRAPSAGSVAIDGVDVRGMGVPKRYRLAW